MNNRDQAPYLAQDAKEVGEVIRIMNNHTQKGKGSFHIRKKTFKISDGSGRTIDSWQLNDWDYKKPHLPTYARGLFTHDNNGKPEIAVRGYDKFFNVGEIRKTEWKNVEKNTRGPYELSVKENGCIIFIAGLDDKTLVVTSKHSTGERGDSSANHALAGEKWVDKHLSAIGKTKADLARRLREMNATAVAELCDDEFEEHVLEYTPDAAGLYLHGINLNLPEFATYPGTQVDIFADEWGFKKVKYIMKDKVEDMRPFLEEVAETGAYNGRDTEGFVIRCQARETADSPWEDWFFKYKFEQPYLMYRQWRECTKAIISGKDPKIRSQKKITEEYLLYARRQLHKDPELGKRYNQNHGIIAMRNGFLKEKGVKGSDIIRQSELDEGGTNVSDGTRNVVLVPVATIGCGKTTLAIALVKLFQWGHEQNDNIQGRANRFERFALAITNSMANHAVVIADRNNHQRREREQIITDVSKVVPEAKFVALHYVHDRANYSKIRKAMQERVLARGDNHQTIQAGSKSTDEIVGIMDGFMKRFEPVDTKRRPDEDFDLVIDLDPAVSSRENLETVVHRLHDEFPKLFKMPSDEDMDKAVEQALTSYKPDIKHDLGRGSKENSNSKKNQTKDDRQAAKHENKAASKPQNGNKASSKPRPMEYFFVSLPTSRITSILDAVFSSVSPETSNFLNQLKSSHRIQPEFHVTLIHRASISQHPDYWNRLTDTWRHQQFTISPDTPATGGTDGGVSLGNVNVQLERVIWDDRVMAIVASLPDAGEEEKGGFKSVNEVAHVTVGTARGEIKPRESNELLKRWRSGNVEAGEGRGVVMEVVVKGSVVLEGVVRGMLSR